MNEIISINENSFQAGLPSIEEIKSIQAVCQSIGNAPFYQKLGPSGCLAIWLTAREMGMPVMHALNGGLHNVEGKIVMSGNLIAGLIRKSGNDYEIIESTDQVCTIQFFRKNARPDAKPCIHSWGVEDAKLAGYYGKIDDKGNILQKPKHNYLAHAKAMFFNRCISSGYKMYLPEIGLFYCEDELDKIEYEEIKTEKREIKLLEEKPQVIEEKKEIVKAEGFDEFCQKYEILECQIGMDYVKEVMENMKTDKTFIEIVNICIQREENFCKAYAKWKDNLKSLKEAAEN